MEKSDKQQQEAANTLKTQDEEDELTRKLIEYMILDDRTVDKVVQEEEKA